VTFDIEIHGVPVTLETDPDTGEVTAYNDALRVMAVGADEAQARRHFDEALRAQVKRDLNSGRPLHPNLRERPRARGVYEGRSGRSAPGKPAPAPQ
jgi:hypothetical protein